MKAYNAYVVGNILTFRIAVSCDDVCFKDEKKDGEDMETPLPRPPTPFA